MSRIADILKEIKGGCLSYRIQKLLKREDLFHFRSYFAVLKKEMDLRSILKRKFVITTKWDDSSLESMGRIIF
jgi:hypothetical protein